MFVEKYGGEVLIFGNIQEMEVIGWRDGAFWIRVGYYYFYLKFDLDKMIY